MRGRAAGLRPVARRFAAHVTRGMKAMLCLLVTVLLALAVGCAGGVDAPAQPPAKSYAFVNGRWFDGQRFQPAAWYAVHGLLTRHLPPGPVETVDLSGLYVVPPFGEAHNHNVEGPWNVQAVAERYLRDGVFYVKNPNNVRDFALQIRQAVNRPTSIDAVFAHAGLTGRGGHPVALYEDVLRLSRYEPAIGPVEKGWFENRSYVVVETEAELEAKWPLITSGRPDFLKIYLVQSDAERRHPPGTGRSGLDPRLVPAIVAKAHAARLQVTAHVETAADFRHAIQGGVDELAHVPGWLIEPTTDVERVRLTEADARLAAERKVRVVTTTVAGRAMPGDGAHPSHGHQAGPGHRQSESAGMATQVLTDNLRLLHRAGVVLLIGSDHAETSLAEALHLHSLHLFDNLTLLKLWCEATPAGIFPGRAIGQFAEGYEASFLALAGNPLEDFEQVRAIRQRFKQGVPLDGALLENAAWSAASQ